MDSRRLAQQIIEKQCDNVAELIRVKEILHSVQDGLANKEEVKKLSNAILKLDELIETL
ncbi:hypothetical protein U2I54_22615 [Bacillus pseudomycoides]|uniref:Aspartyl-phosphate phosphatase Spo0E family protein n=1 Tax=Bacillus bingmayongensis TaxID=1150157 RepID=A0ABU5K2B7_9BACI|nr:hypothetical protein [Bacillus pseudomycoides]